MSPLAVEVLLTLFDLAMILVAAELFTNGIEWLGHKLNLSEGAVGSVLAAVGTALPETIIPVMAIIADLSNGTLGTAEGKAQEIGLGAIIGAPFMLGTLAFLLVGLTFFIARATKKRSKPFDVRGEIIMHDLEFFMLAFGIGCGVGVLKHYWPAMPYFMDWGLAAILVVVYFVYLARVFSGAAVKEAAEDTHDPKLVEAVKHDPEVEGHSIAELHPLYIHRMLKRSHDPRKRVIALQILAALGLMFYGAHEFVQHFSFVAESFGVPSLILALLLVPVATELPEKFNSVIWVSRGKDTLAMGNISGAMVFQSTFPISLGLIFLDWSFSPTHPAFIGGMLGVLGALGAWISLKLTKEINPYTLLFGGLLYLIYIVLVVLQLNGVPVFDLSRGLGHGAH